MTHLRPVRVYARPPKFPPLEARDVGYRANRVNAHAGTILDGLDLIRTCKYTRPVEVTRRGRVLSIQLTVCYLAESVYGVFRVQPLCHSREQNFKNRLRRIALIQRNVIFRIEYCFFFICTMIRTHLNKTGLIHISTIRLSIKRCFI